MKPRPPRRPILRALVGAVGLPLFALSSPASPISPAMMPCSLASSHTKLTLSHTFEVPLPLSAAFIFFEPVGEKLWATDWNPVFNSSADRVLGTGTVFTVTRTRDGAPETSIWMITQYEPGNGIIEYRSVYPGFRVSRVAVHCRNAGLSRTAVTVTYTHTGLSDAGDRFIAEITEEKYRDSIEEWGRAIHAYLQRGTPASP